MNLRFHGMIGIEVRKLTCKIAVEKKLTTAFDAEKGMAGAPAECRGQR